MLKTLCAWPERYRGAAGIAARTPSDAKALSVASLMSPTLTTVRQDRVQMARAAFQRLLERIADPSLPPCDIFLPAPLVVRESTEKTHVHKS